MSRRLHRLLPVWNSSDPFSDTLETDPMRILFAANLLCFFASYSSAGLVLKDHVSDPGLWNGIDPLIGQAYPFENPHLASAVVAEIVGNGHKLKSISGIFAHNDVFDMPNHGSPERMSFRFMFFETTAAYQADPFLESTGTGKTLSVFSSPTNIGWNDPVGISLDGHQLFRWQFDVEHLGVQTQPGKTHVVGLVPVTDLATGTAFLAFSRGGTTAVGSEDDWARSRISGIGPDTFANLGAAHPHAAYRITSIPEPSAPLSIAFTAALFFYARKPFVKGTTWTKTATSVLLAKTHAAISLLHHTADLTKLVGGEETNGSDSDQTNQSNESY